jgi:hypothetical protein
MGKTFHKKNDNPQTHQIVPEGPQQGLIAAPVIAHVIHGASLTTFAH